MRKIPGAVIALVAAAAIAAGLSAAAYSKPKPGHKPPHAHGHKSPRLSYLGQAIFPTATTFGGTTVGGLSSITYDRKRGVYYALSDDQGQLQPARFYTLSVNTTDGHLDNGDVTFTGVTTLLAPDGNPYPVASLDPEGLTLTKKRELILTSEGFAVRNIAPFVRRYSLDGRFLGDLPVPAAYLPTGPTHGVRNNLAFEAAAVTPDGNHLYVGMENALVQDGPAASLTTGSPARILRYNVDPRKLEREYVYDTDPIVEPPVPPTQFAVNGLDELLMLGHDYGLAMERSFSVGAPGTGNTIKLYTVDFHGATDVKGLDSITGVKKLKPVDKSLLLDLRTLGIPLDNIEGMTLGPKLPDGRRSLVLVSDNNFAASQFTQFLLFALD